MLEEASMRERRSIFLVAAFAALLAICGGVALAVWRNTQLAQADSARIHQRDMAIHEALAEIRSGVYLTAILARDAMLDPSVGANDYRQQLDDIQGRMAITVEKLRQQITDPESEEVVNRLTAELDGYAVATETILAWTPQERVREQANTLLQRGVRRRDILTLAERIEMLALKSTEEQRALMNAGDQSFRSSLAWIAGVALLLGSAVAAFTVFRMRTLEAQSAAAESKLRSLSGQLRTAQEDERKYLSRELHDQVGQMLTGLRMELSAISRSKAAATPEVSAALERAKANTEQTLSVVRNIAMLLRPSMLDDLGLTPALAWLAREMERSSEVEIRRFIDPRVDQLPDAHRTCLYRIVQEALTNSARHSGARSVDLHVTSEGGSVRVRVTDDGRGFDPILERRKGLGLLGMEERVRELGGQLRIMSVAGRGASVEVFLPEPHNFEENRIHANENSNGDDRGRSRDRPDRVETSI